MAALKKANKGGNGLARGSSDNQGLGGQESNQVQGTKGKESLYFRFYGCVKRHSIALEIFRSCSNIAPTQNATATRPF